MQPSATVTLNRPLLFRLWFGCWLQAYALTLAVIVVVVLILRAAGSSGKNGLTWTEGLIALVVLGSVIAVGATGHAEFDERGVRWRYYGSHAYDWSEIETIKLSKVSIGINAWRSSIEVYARGRRHRVMPATNGGQGRIAFGHALAAAAQQHGVPVEDYWPR